MAAEGVMERRPRGVAVAESMVRVLGVDREEGEVGQYTVGFLMDFKGNFRGFCYRFFAGLHLRF